MREIRQSGSEGGESNLPYPSPAPGEVGEALGTVSAHDSALKGAVQTSTIAKPHRKQPNGPFRMGGAAPIAGVADRVASHGYTMG